MLGRNTVLILGSLIFVGCASGVKRGVVAMKLNDKEAHVGVGSKEVSVGDHVELYRNICTGTGGKVDNRTCSKKSFGHGEITNILNDDYAVVKFPDGTDFAEGDTIEKHSH